MGKVERRRLRGPAGPRLRFRLWLYRAYAEGVERVEPEPRTVGDAKEGGSLVAELSLGPSPQGRPGRGYGSALPLERVGQRCKML